ncbi:myosin 1 [Pseudohyphozyma bogoriensis]|nr:myosin 1 [Pseudohyphozyma bogoriensis]
MSSLQSIMNLSSSASPPPPPPGRDSAIFDPLRMQACIEGFRLAVRDITINLKSFGATEEGLVENVKNLAPALVDIASKVKELQINKDLLLLTQRQTSSKLDTLVHATCEGATKLDDKLAQMSEQGNSLTTELSKAFDTISNSLRSIEQEIKSLSGNLSSSATDVALSAKLEAIMNSTTLTTRQLSSLLSSPTALPASFATIANRLSSLPATLNTGFSSIHQAGSRFETQITKVGEGLARDVEKGYTSVRERLTGVEETFEDQLGEVKDYVLEKIGLVELCVKEEVGRVERQLEALTGKASEVAREVEEIRQAAVETKEKVDGIDRRIDEMLKLLENGAAVTRLAGDPQEQTQTGGDELSPDDLEAQVDNSESRDEDASLGTLSSPAGTIARSLATVIASVDIDKDRQVSTTDAVDSHPVLPDWPSSTTTLYNQSTLLRDIHPHSPSTSPLSNSSTSAPTPRRIMRTRKRSAGNQPSSSNQPLNDTSTINSVSPKQPLRRGRRRIVSDEGEPPAELPPADGRQTRASGKRARNEQHESEKKRKVDSEVSRQPVVGLASTVGEEKRRRRVIEQDDDSE